MNRKAYHYLFILVLCLNFSSCQSIYKLFKHAQNTTAKCIDGSPSALYIYEGQADKILLYFQGGGMCFGADLAGTIENCYNRSKTSLGSSKSYSQTKDLNDFSIMSNNQNFNPLYWTWTKVYIPYCDGVLHLGSKLSAIQYKGTQLYLRGMNNTLAHFQYLNNKYGLYNAKKVVISGTSAGALAAYRWSNTLYKRLKNPNGLLTIFDSGQFVSQFFNPFTNSTPGIDYFKSIVSLSFTEQLPPYQQCMKVQSRIDCDKFGVMVNYILSPIFVIESEYDLYAIKNIILLDCPLRSFPGSLERCNDTEITVIQEYRQKSIQSWKNVTKYQKNGIWAISCVQHGFLYRHQFMSSEFYLIPSSTGSSAMQTLKNFVNGSGNKILIDEVKWPINQGCRGYTNLKITQQ